MLEVFEHVFGEWWIIVKSSQLVVVIWKPHWTTRSLNIILISFIHLHKRVHTNHSIHTFNWMEFHTVLVVLCINPFCNIFFQYWASNLTRYEHNTRLPGSVGGDDLYHIRSVSHVNLNIQNGIRKCNGERCVSLAIFCRKEKRIIYFIVKLYIDAFESKQCVWFLDKSDWFEIIHENKHEIYQNVAKQNHRRID